MNFCCQIYEDVVKVQRFFIELRDKLTRSGEICWSPANRYTERRLEASIEEEKNEKSEPPEEEEEETDDEVRVMIRV